MFMKYLENAMVSIIIGNPVYNIYKSTSFPVQCLNLEI